MTASNSTPDEGENRLVEQERQKQAEQRILQTELEYVADRLMYLAHQRGEGGLEERQIVEQLHQLNAEFSVVLGWVEDSDRWGT